MRCDICNTVLRDSRGAYRNHLRHHKELSSEERGEKYRERFPPKAKKPRPKQDPKDVAYTSTDGIPARLPNGKQNPEYLKAYRGSKKGRQSIDDWNQSEKGKACRARYRKTPTYRNHRINKESPEEYANRILKDIPKGELH